MPAYLTPGQGAHLLKQSEIIAYPTEAVFGLGCDPCSEKALKGLLSLKMRDWEKGLILIASDVMQLVPYLDFTKLSAQRWQEVLSTWPGPYTWVIPAQESVSSLLRGKYSSIAVRVTAHPVPRALCEAFQGAIVSTSANVSDMAPCKDAEDVKACFEGRIAGVVGGKVGELLGPTTIQDALTGQLYRQGQSV